MNKALFAGSFDPFTLGHLDIVQRASRIFSELTVLIAVNPHKAGQYPVSIRAEMVRLSVQELGNVRIDQWSGLTVAYMQEHGIRTLVRGVRNALDLEWEQSVAWANHRIDGGMETVLFPASSEHHFLSSSAVREMLSHQVDVTGLVHPDILPLLTRPC